MTFKGEKVPHYTGSDQGGQEADLEQPITGPRAKGLIRAARRINGLCGCVTAHVAGFEKRHHIRWKQKASHLPRIAARVCALEVSGVGGNKIDEPVANRRPYTANGADRCWNVKCRQLQSGAFFPELSRMPKSDAPRRVTQLFCDAYCASRRA